jgi:hypothetical protein
MPGTSPGMTKKEKQLARRNYYLRATLSPPGRLIYALLFALTPLNDTGTVSGSFPSLCTAARMAAMYP